MSVLYSYEVSYVAVDGDNKRYSGGSGSEQNIPLSIMQLLNNRARFLHLSFLICVTGEILLQF